MSCLPSNALLLLLLLLAPRSVNVLSLTMDGGSSEAEGSALQAAERSLQAGNAALEASRFRLAAEHFGKAAELAPVTGLAGQSVLVAAAEGLNACGEVTLAANAFGRAVAELQAGKRRKPSKSKKVLAARVSTGLAEAMARSNREAAEKREAIKVAASSKPAPAMQWYLWAANTLQSQLKDEGAALSVFEQGVLHVSDPLPLYDPAFANRLRQLLQMRPPGAAARQKLDARLLQEHHTYLQILPPAGESRGDPSKVQAGGLGDVWRVRDPVSGNPLFRYGAGVFHQLQLEGLSEPVTMVPLAESPLSFVVDGFATAGECEALIAEGRPQLVPSMVTSSQISAHRTSSSTEWLHHRLDSPAVRTILQRAAQLVGIPGVQPADFELQLVHYAAEQFYKFHYDATLSTDHITTGMARYVTMLLYLTDVDAGGETLLPLAADGLKSHGCVGCERKPGASIDWREDACIGCMKPHADRLLEKCAHKSNSGVVSVPRGGRLLLFYNYDSDGRFDPASIHAGCSVRAGEKLAVSSILHCRRSINSSVYYMYVRIL